MPTTSSSCDECGTRILRQPRLLCHGRGGVVEKGTLGSHFTHVLRQNEKRRDEVMPYLGNIGQMFGLEVHDVPFAIKLPLTPPVGQDLEDLGVVWMLIELIKRLRGDRIKIIELVDRLCAEVYQHTTHPDL